MDTNRFVQVDAYGPDDKDGRGRECSVKGWCGDDDACLLASLLIRVDSGDRLWPATRSQYVGRVQYYNRLYCRTVTLDV